MPSSPLSLSPSSPAFLGARETDSADAVILGAPLDLTETFRPGTGAAPTRIRLVSDVLETYSPRLERDLEEDIALADWGDVALEGLQMDEALAAIEETLLAVPPTAFPLVLGGEHTVALAGVRALRKRYPNLLVLQVDAHADLRDEYLGVRVGHATAFRRVLDEVGSGSIVQLGLRSGTREELALARDLLHSSPQLTLPWPLVAARPIYLSIDMDVLDPAYAPGTGCPEPGGPTFTELLEFIYSLRCLHVVGADICEVLPQYDPADITSVAAAKIARELVLMFAGVSPAKKGNCHG